MQMPGAFTRLLLLLAGGASILLGIVGIFLPVLPTTPFLLLAAACFIRSSPKAYTWLLQNPCLGKYIEDYRLGKGISLRSKIISMLMLWSMILFSCCRVRQHPWLIPLLLLTAAAVSRHVLKIPTKK